MRSQELMKHLRASEEGFSIIEVAIATMMVVLFFMAFAMSIDASTNNVRGNRNNTSAAGLMAEEIEFARSLRWDELAMTGVDTGSPLLVPGQTTVSGSKVGLSSNEPLVVDPANGQVSPRGQATLEENTYTKWRHVTSAGTDLRRVIVLISWVQQGTPRTLQTTTLISRVTAEGAVAIGGTTTTSTTTPGSTTSTTAGPTTTTMGTTTTTKPLTKLVVYKVELKLEPSRSKSTADVTVKDQYGSKIQNVTVHIRWSVSPGKAGYPFTNTGLTDKKGEVTLVHNDTFPKDTLVTVCVTNLVKAGYTYVAGDVCVTRKW